jgi:UPF0755 protein
MRIVKILSVLFAVAILSICGVSYWVYSTVRRPQLHEKSNEYITIEKGSTPKQIVEKLANEGIIPSYSAAILYLRTVGTPSKLQAGDYQFDSPITTLQVLQKLEKGEEQTTKITIPEGFTRFDIAKRIAEKFPQDPPMDDKDVLRLMDDTSLIKDIAPKALNLEGYMYPSTYSFPRDAKPAEVIKAMVEQFRKVWKPEWTEKAVSIGRTPHELVTIASLIETESGVESERPIVASVIYNRLNRNIPLGIDQTVVYIAKMQGRWDGAINRSDLDADSPYNTRKYGGLPPGPISSVSESALRAALEPAQTNYLYYVRNVQVNDGSHWFYASAAEFEKGKAEYQRWLEQERQEKRAEEEANQQQH